MIKGTGQGSACGDVVRPQGGPTSPGAENRILRSEACRSKLQKGEGHPKGQDPPPSKEKEWGIFSGPQLSGPPVRISARHEGSPIPPPC